MGKGYGQQNFQRAFPNNWGNNGWNNRSYSQVVSCEVRVTVRGCHMSRMSPRSVASPFTPSKLLPIGQHFTIRRGVRGG